MGKNRSMAAKHAKAKMAAVEDNKVRMYGDIAVAHRLALSGVVSASEVRKNMLMEQAEKLADIITRKQYPNWEKGTRAVKVEDGKRRAIQISEAEEYHFGVIQSSYRLLDNGMEFKYLLDLVS